MLKALVIVLVLALGGARNAEAREIPGAPDFEAPLVGGGRVRLHDLVARGPVLLDFWALWCKPCLKELPELDRLHREYAGRGLTVLAINGDSPADVARVAPFVKSRGFAFPVVLDLDGRLRRRFQVNALPTAILLDAAGNVAWTNQGYRPGDEKTLEAKLLPLLGPAPEDSLARPAGADSAVAPSPRNGVN